MFKLPLREKVLECLLTSLKRQNQIRLRSTLLECGAFPPLLFLFFGVLREFSPIAASAVKKKSGGKAPQSK
jgi:hypothetical protein